MSYFPRNTNAYELFVQLRLEDTDFQKDLLMNINNNEDSRNYFYATSDIEEMVYNDIDLHIIGGRFILETSWTSIKKNQKCS